MATKLDRVVTYDRKIPHIKLHDLLITWYMTNIKPYICTSGVVMSTELGRVVTFDGRTQPSKSRGCLITW